MGRRSLIACAAFTILMGGATWSGAQIRAEIIATGFDAPVAVMADPTDRSAFFLVEQGGLIRLVRNGAALETPFLDLREAISAGGERGLLGFALAPDYAESRRFYVNFTNPNGDTVVARFRRREDDARAADPESRFDLRWPDGRRYIEQPFSNHNGGHLAFGPDGYLYIGLGDGGSGGDPFNHAQNRRSLLGKMLRIDVNVPLDDERGYRVPEDNPFLDGDPIDALPEIWAFGLRNPWRYSFDDWTRGGTAALTIGDVGQNAREELNFEPRGRGGRNYGWRLREGRQSYEARTSAAFFPLTDPIHDYGRAIGASVTGGMIYRGAALDPRYHGRYLFADFARGRVFSLGLHLDPLTGEAQADDEQEHTAALGSADTLGLISSFGVDHDGELLLLNYAAGRVVRIAPDFDRVPQPPFLNGTIDGDLLQLAWNTGDEGVQPVSFAIELVRGGAVVERVETERTEWSMTALPGDCARVRGVSRTASGPPSAAICLP